MENNQENTQFLYVFSCQMKLTNIRDDQRSDSKC